MRQFLATLLTMLSIGAGIAAAGPAGGGAAGEPGGAAKAPGAMVEAAGEDGEANHRARDRSAPDGIYWYRERRLTDNKAVDSHPQLAASSVGTTGVAWSRDGIFMWKKIDRLGNELVAERQAACGTFPVQCSGFVSPCIGADSNENFHIAFRDGDLGVYYSKLNSQGGALIAKKSVPSGGVSVHAPSIAVGPSGTVHVTYEDHRWGMDCEALVYARLLNNGTVDKDGFRITEKSWVVSGSTVCADQMNNLHAVFIVKDQGAFHAKLDNFGNPLPQTPPTFLYPITGQFDYTGPAAVCADPTGGIHLAWNTNNSGVGTIKYMKLDNNGNKLAAGVDKSGISLSAYPSAIGYPAIASDRWGRTFVFWSDLRNGNPGIWYVEINNGKENDTLLPDRALCLTRDGTNCSAEPAAAVDADGNLHVAWRDDRDGNPEIYYVFGASNGVELGMTPEEMAKIMYVHLNETKSANLTVRNMGGANDTASLGVSLELYGKKGGVGKNYTGPGYKVWIDERNREIDLDPQEIVKVPLYVRGASEAVPNEYIKITIHAASKMNPNRNDTVEFRVYTVVDHKISLRCVERVHSAPAGVMTQYSITVMNIGNVEEAIDLSARGPPAWNYSLGRDRVRLKPGEQTVVDLNVTPPADAYGNDVGIVEVRGTCSNNPGVFSEVETKTVVSVIMWTEIWPERAELSLLPGGTADCRLTVASHGNFGWVQPFLLSAAVDSPGWSASLDTASVALRNEDEGMAVLRLTAPPGAPAGSRAEVRLLCSDPDKSHLSGCNVTAVVERVRGLDIAVTPAEASVVPGGTAVFRIALSNTGNAPDEAGSWGFLVPPGWNLSLFLPNGKPLEGAWSLELEAGERAEVVAELESPADALAGTCIVPGRFLDGAKEPRGFRLAAAVLPVRQATLYSPSPTLRGSPGGTLRFPLVLLNRGNLPERFDLSCLDRPDGWEAPAILDREGSPAGTASVEAHSSQNFTLVLRIPPLTRLAVAALNISADAADMHVPAGLSVVMDYPDLAIASLAASVLHPRPGELVYVNVTVENRGRAAARGVSLDCYRNNEALIDRELGDIGPGESRVESFVWIPKAGHNVLVFMVDPKDTVPETDETGNTALMTRYVSGPLPAEPDRSGWMVAGAAAVLAASVALAALRLLARPRRRR